MNIAKYSKLIAAIVGMIAVIIGPDVLGLTADTEQAAQNILGLLTVFGVYLVPNKVA